MFRCLSLLGALLISSALLSPLSHAAALRELQGALAWPWSLAELPDGRLLVTEREGTLKLLSAEGAILGAIEGVPKVWAKSQGGLFDVLLAPDFETSQQLYLSYAHGTPEANGTRISRAKLEQGKLAELTPLFTVAPLKDTPVHYGGRLAWGPEGALYLTTGDGFDYREAAQKLDSLLGKTLRLTAEGAPFPGNPFADVSGARAEIWSLGHRNPQGLVFTPDGQIWAHEHGPQGGDELNRLEGGANYGWPVATFGIDYNGARISPFERYPGMADSAWHWTPSIGPSGLAYRPEAGEAGRGTFYLGALAIPGLYAATRQGQEITGVKRILPELTERIRDVRLAKDGGLFILTDGNPGRLLHFAL
ncbi:MAG: hypothetical protein RLZZ174_1312 [Pseudomonadota bacterium]|jgi:glucose/arabinose dehydrogenase